MFVGVDHACPWRPKQLQLERLHQLRSRCVTLDSPEGVLWEEVGDDDTTTPVVGPCDSRNGLGNGELKIDVTVL